MRRCTREGVTWPRAPRALLLDGEWTAEVRAIYGAEARQLDLRTLCDCALLAEVLPPTPPVTLAWVPSGGCDRCGKAGQHAPRRYPPRDPDALRAWMARGSLSLDEYRRVLRHERRLREQALILSWRDGDDLDERLSLALDGAA